MADTSFLRFRNFCVFDGSVGMSGRFRAGESDRKTADSGAITSGYGLFSVLLSLQETPYVILLAQSADNVTYQYIARG